MATAAAAGPASHAFAGDRAKGGSLDTTSLSPSDIHVLLVDDERLSRLVVGNLLRKCSYRVTEAESGLEALDILRRSEPDTFQLVLTDVMMPDVNGIELLRHLRSDDSFKGLPVVMMSANEHTDTVFECIRGGAEDYLLKPVTKKEVQYIWQHVWRRQQAAALRVPHLGQEAEEGEENAAGTEPVPSAPLDLVPPEKSIDLRGPTEGPDSASDVAGQPSVSAAGSCAAAPTQPASSSGTVDAETAAQLSARRRSGAEAEASGQQPAPGGAPPAAAAGHASASAQPPPPVAAAQTVLLAEYFARRRAVVNSSDSFRIFCQVLGLLRPFHAQGTPVQRVRPSCLRLTSTGIVTFLAAGADSAHAAAEQILYASPEELLHIAPTPKCDVYSLGVLFFELFNPVVDPAERSRVLGDLRHRILPMSVLQHRPQEAAFVVSLLHPDPRARPTVDQILASNMLAALQRSLCGRAPVPMGANAAAAQLRAARRAAAAEEDRGVLLDFLRLMRRRKVEEDQNVRRQVDELEADISEVQSRLKECAYPAPAATPRLSRSPKDSSARSEGPAATHRTGEITATHAGVHSEDPLGAAAEAVAAASGLATGGRKRSRSEAEAAEAAGAPETLPRPHQQQQQQPNQQPAPQQPPVASPAHPEHHQASHSQDVHYRQQPHLHDQQPHHDQNHPQEQLHCAEQPLHYQSSAQQNSHHTAHHQQHPQQQQAQQQQQQQQQQEQQQQQQQQQPVPLLAPEVDAKKVRIERLGQVFSHLEEAFFRRRDAASAPRTGGLLEPLGQPDYLNDFAEELHAFTRYSELKVKATLKYGDLGLQASDMVCAVAFDRDDEFFATAGVSRRIKVFDYGLALDSGVAIHYPVREIASRSKLSCVCWNSYVKSNLISSDYDGAIRLWDVAGGGEEAVAVWEEHSKRVWSVDFSATDPTRFLSGSDDGTVRLWSMNDESAVACIDSKANVCSVQFSPQDSNLMAFGSANYRVYLYDLRQIQVPLAVVSGHSKAVSYVRFMGGTHVVSASTDSRLKLWDIARAGAGGEGASQPECTYSGHTNEKNFVGLSVSPEGYIVCGSENNSVYAYHRSTPVPLTQHAFGRVDPLTGRELEGREEHQFVSSVCWNRRASALVAANSAGHIKILELA